MRLSRFIGAPLLAAALAIGGHPAFADDNAAATVKVGTLEISGAFARATLPGAMSGGGYLTITNGGTTDERLLSVATPMAKTALLHDSKMEGSVMTMTPVKDGIDIPPGKTVTLSPSGLHIMFMRLAGPFKQGATVPLTLTFATAGKVEVKLAVLGIAASGPAAGTAPAADPMAGMSM